MITLLGVEPNGEANHSYTVNANRPLVVGDVLVHTGGTRLADQLLMVKDVDSFDKTYYPYLFVPVDTPEHCGFWGVGGELVLCGDVPQEPPKVKRAEECWIVHGPYNDVLMVCTNRDRADQVCKQGDGERYVKPYTLSHLKPLPVKS